MLAALEGGVLDECGGVGGVPGAVVGGGAGAVEELGLVGLGGEGVHFARRWRGGRGGLGMVWGEGIEEVVAGVLGRAVGSVGWARGVGRGGRRSAVHPR